MVTLATVDPATRTFAQQRQRLRDASVATATALWANMVDGPSDDIAGEWAEEFATRREAYLVQTALVTDAYMDTWLERQGRAPRSEGIDPEEIAAAVRPGVDHRDIGRRPIHTTRQALSDGRPLATALDQGRHRLANIVATDSQQTYRLGMRERLRREGIRSYRRVTASSEPCALCVIASTNRYHSNRLAPIHPGCHCIVVPGAPSASDRQVLDELREVLDGEGVAVGDRAQLANMRVRMNVRSIDDVTEVAHGELGPILSVRQHRSTEFSDLPPWVQRSRREFLSQRQRQEMRRTARRTFA